MTSVLALLVLSQVKSPVLLELFTSEGCSSCPPADVALERLARDGIDGTEVIPLSFHVDYWNRLGWEDPYSRAEFTQRQFDYSGDEVYTPMMVLDGASIFVGGEASARQRVRAHQVTPKGALHVGLSRAGRTLHVSGAQLTVERALVAVVENSAVSKVVAGENEGKTLQHTAVVRELVPLTRHGEVDVTLKPGWDLSKFSIVAFAHAGSDRRVTHLERRPLPR